MSSLLDQTSCDLFGIVFTKFMVYSGEEISDFRLCYGRFSPTEI